MEKLGKYGHHADPEIDADVEVERLRGMLCEAQAGLIRAQDFNAASPEGLQVKRDVRHMLYRIGGYHEDGVKLRRPGDLGPAPEAP